MDGVAATTPILPVPSRVASWHVHPAERPNQVGRRGLGQGGGCLLDVFSSGPEEDAREDAPILLPQGLTASVFFVFSFRGYLHTLYVVFQEITLDLSLLSRNLLLTYILFS
jgi:hypothetical protein